MHFKWVLLTFSLASLMIGGCVSENEHEKPIENKKVQPVMQNETTDDLPSFVKLTDFKSIDWEKPVTIIGTNGNSPIVGNPKKLGFVGPDLQAKKIDKWLWHIYGKTAGKLTVVAYHQDSSTKVPFLTVGYTNEFSGGAMNGAAATMPSNVTLPKAGKWALLVYINEQLFDTLVIDVHEKETE